MAHKSLKQVQREVESNDPPVEVNQRWVAKNGNKVLRQIRILAQYPEPTPYKEEGRAWLYVDESVPNGMIKHDLSRIGVCPEFNLRFVFRLKK